MRNGWKPFIASCLRSDQGEPTAGVAIFVRKHIGAAPLEGPLVEPRDQTGTIVNGWAIAVHVDFGMRGGLIVSSLYLECGKGIGIETRSWQRLLKVGEIINHYGKPYCIGGDFSCPLDTLARSGWPASIQGRIQAPVGGSCRSSQGTWSTIDYMVLSRHLQLAVLHLYQVGAEAPRPHVPIQMKLDAKPRQYRERTLKKTEQFPKFFPVGPTRSLRRGARTMSRMG